LFLFERIGDIEREDEGELVGVRVYADVGSAVENGGFVGAFEVGDDVGIAVRGNVGIEKGGDCVGGSEGGAVYGSGTKRANTFKFKSIISTEKSFDK